MGLYNFQERFVAAIESGAKRQTIRARRKHQDGPGDTLHLYRGLRHKGARLLMRVECTWSCGIEIDRTGSIYVNAEVLTFEEREKFALDDGFASHAEMMTFWQGRLPFSGQVLGWAPPLTVQ